MELGEIHANCSQNLTEQELIQKIFPHWGNEDVEMQAVKVNVSLPSQKGFLFKNCFTH